MVLRQVSAILFDVVDLNQLLTNPWVSILPSSLDDRVEVLATRFEKAFLLEKLVHLWLEPFSTRILHLNELDLL